MPRLPMATLLLSLGLFAGGGSWAAPPTTPVPTVPDIPTMAQVFVKALGLPGVPVCSSAPVQGTPLYSCTVMAAFSPFTFACDPETECFGVLPWLGMPSTAPGIPPMK